MEMVDGMIGDITELKLRGRLDSTSAGDLKEKVKSCIKAGQVRMIVEMSGVDFVDSSGLGSLVACLRSVNKAGGDIKIASLQDRVRVVFELIRLHHIFEIYDDSTTAAKSFSVSS